MQKIYSKLTISFSLSIIIVGIVSGVNSVALKTFSTSCICDITDACDNQCCCDVECPAQLTSILTKYNRCQNDNFGIPLCQKLNITDVHYDDLYSGLKTIYTVIKRLFCVSRINIVDPTVYYNQNWVATDTIKTDAIDRISSKIASSTLRTANIASLNQVQINFAIYRSDLGKCTKVTSIPAGLGTNGVQECRTLLDPAGISSNQFLAIQKLPAYFSGIKVYSMSQSSIETPSNLTSPSPSSACTASASGNVCTSIVKFIKLFINPTNNAVNQELSYVVLGDLSIQDSAYVMLRYDYEYLNTDGTFANSSNVGYKIGTPLQLLKRYTDSSGNIAYKKILNPLNLAFRTSDGKCRVSVVDTADQSMVQLRLGKNQFHTCTFSSTTTDILLYQNLKNSFNLIGVMGSSNRVLGDYVTVNWPTKLTNILLKIYYTKIGMSENPQYYILKADVLEVNALNQRTLFIQYQEVANNASMYIPPPPTVDAYLPNDFLYPFYVAA